MRRLLFFCIFLASLGVGILFSHSGHLRDVYAQVCDLTQEHYFKDDVKLVAWVQRCRAHAAALSVWSSKADLLDDVRDLMSQMGISHFQIYSPAEDRKLWLGEAIDNGIRARFVEDHLVVYRVLPGSAADQGGVKAGDDILTVPGTEQLSEWGAEHRSGVFKLKRAGQVRSIALSAQTFVEDENPRLSVLPGGVAWLELPSFRAEFYEGAAWRKMAARLADFKRVVLDVRFNSGGNFVAMLRALSTFTCAETNIGTLLQPRKQGEPLPAMVDNTADDFQIQQLDRFRNLGLHTFTGYGCFEGPVTLLIGPDTSSVAEIFAHSFLNRPLSRVWGQPTAGDVVLAVWYDLPSLGPGFSMSVPEAYYVTPSGHELEGSGVWPQRELYYDLELSLKGKDTWIEEALKR